MWWRQACWGLDSVGLQTQEEIEEYLSVRQRRRAWPFLFGNRYTVSEAGFVISPDLILRNPYRFRLVGQLPRSGQPAVVCIRLGVGTLIEAFVIGACFLIAIAVVPIIFQSRSASGNADFGAIVLATPLVVGLTISLFVRMWLSWRVTSFVKSMAEAHTALGSGGSGT